MRSSLYRLSVGFIAVAGLASFAFSAMFGGDGGVIVGRFLLTVALGAYLLAAGLRGLTRLLRSRSSVSTARPAVDSDSAAPDSRVPALAPAEFAVVPPTVRAATVEPIRAEPAAPAEPARAEPAAPAAAPAEPAVPEHAPETATPETTVVPLLAQVTPPDGATVYGTETIVSWTAVPGAAGRVLWRRAGAGEMKAVATTPGPNCLARIGPLETGSSYEYLVEQTSGVMALTRQRVLTVQPGLEFDPAVIEVTLPRDYVLPVQLTLRNHTKNPVTVAARCLGEFADLPAGIVGAGSVDEPATVASGESLALRLSVTAVDAEGDAYEIPIEAGGALATVHVRVPRPELELSLKELGDDPITLAKTLELRNEGATVGALWVGVAAPNDRDVRLQPTAWHAYLGEGKTLRVTATPILFLEFESLTCQLECRAAGRLKRFPLQFTAPAGRHLLGVRVGCYNTTSSADWFCSNRPVICTQLPGSLASGPAAFPRSRDERCESLRNETFDLDKLQAWLNGHSKTFRETHDRFKRQQPAAVIAHQIDFDLRQDSGGGTTSGSCGDDIRAIVLNPVDLCKRPGRDLIKAYVHEFGHITLCSGPTPADEDAKEQMRKKEEAAIDEFIRKVEDEIYEKEGPRRDPFRSPL